MEYYPRVLIPVDLQGLLEPSPPVVRAAQPEVNPVAIESEGSRWERVAEIASRKEVRLGGIAIVAAVLGGAIGQFGAIILIPLALLLGGIALLVIESKGLPDLENKRGAPDIGRARLQSRSAPRSRLDLFSGRASAVQLPLGVSSAPRGVSESFFYQHLQAVFGPLVIFGQEVEIADYDYNYSTDFSLIWRDLLYFDIEIDEVYTGSGKTAQPTHCADRPKDARRDRFFADRGWIVIRFAEEQVIRQPRECCRAIATVLGQLSGEFSYLAKLEGVSELLKVNSWTYRQAIRRSRDRYRERLLAEIGITYGRQKKR